MELRKKVVGREGAKFSCEECERPIERGQHFYVLDLGISNTWLCPQCLDRLLSMLEEAKQWTT